MGDVAMQGTKPWMLPCILLQHRRGRLWVRCNFQVSASNSTIFSPTGWGTPIGSNIRFENSIPRPQLPCPSPVAFPPLETGISKIKIIAENVVHAHRQVKEGWRLPSLYLHHFTSLNLAHMWSPRATRTLFKGLGRKVVLIWGQRSSFHTHLLWEKCKSVEPSNFTKGRAQHQSHYAKQHTQWKPEPGPLLSFSREKHHPNI